MERVVITGLGILCSIGKDLQEFKTNLRNGNSGLKQIPTRRFDTSLPVYRNNSACILEPELYDDLYEKDATILSDLSKKVVQDAIEDAGLQMDKINNRRMGVAVATSVGASYPFMRWVKNKIDGEPAKDINLLFHTTSTIGGNIAKQYDLRGPISTISTACAAGTNSIGRGFDFISKGRVDYMIAGGVDVFTELTYSGFNALQAISKGACKPFDKNRDGLNLGDAGAFVILESLSSAKKRNAKIYAEIKGYSTINEAYHATAPCPDGGFAYSAMQKALLQGKIDIGKVEYINAHGTATAANDTMEIKAIRKLADKRPVFVSSTKSMTGHTLGAAGSVELVATTVAMHDGFIPPTINLSDPILEAEDHNLVIVKDKGLDYKFDTAISNSFGFAGNMSAIAIQSFS
ncbi:MAG: 3-oxoacyl-ACP synthase [Thalassobius sp.]|nr:3-oxoacyl-ACP synthase [Thalassovita sp.]